MAVWMQERSGGSGGRQLKSSEGNEEILNLVELPAALTVGSTTYDG